MKTRRKNSRFVLKAVSIITVFFLFTGIGSAHCDTMDGPVIKDAKTTIGTNNINYVLKWIQPADEKELIEAFELVMKVRTLGVEARMLSDRYFFETVIRLHRNGEGVSYTGLKPPGTPVDIKILKADEAIETNSLDPLKGLVPEDRFHELEERFRKVMSLKNFSIGNIEAGREYVMAYVNFFKFAEGEYESHEVHRH